MGVRHAPGSSTLATGGENTQRAAAHRLVPTFRQAGRVGLLRSRSQFDDGQVLSPRQVAHAQLESLATTTHRSLRSGARGAAAARRSGLAWATVSAGVFSDVSGCRASKPPTRNLGLPVGGKVKSLRCVNLPLFLEAFTFAGRVQGSLALRLHNRRPRELLRHSSRNLSMAGFLRMAGSGRGDISTCCFSPDVSGRRARTPLQIP
jgi:hypothetical protein